ncbi:MULTISPECIES: hypothetical protein [unclassified Paenibacillus]|uniref:hypothetical protein n=1 Tax=unclassified Paenibacillus TaxID=185978 RepID=UPI0008380289|nr:MULTISPECIES: hypothetical protein [unclassified Paenibacillus]NWL87252.1 hypothetical protein [Paenibacillus sp. 79R4]
MRPLDQASMQIWKAYIQGKLTWEEEKRLENMLLEDEEAALLYSEALSSLESELPEMREDGPWLEGLMASLPDSSDKAANPDKEQGSIGRWFNQAWLQYVIAASITMLLMTGGFFDHLFSRANEAIHRPNQEISVSDRLMKATTGWFDKWNK